MVGSKIFGSFSFKRDAHFGQYWKLHQLSLKLDPAHHKIQFYNLLMVRPFDPADLQYC